MRKIYTTTQSGSDTLSFYDISSDCGEAKHTNFRIVHLQEWSDLVGDCGAEDMEKYNVVAHDVRITGFDDYKAASAAGKPFEGLTVGGVTYGASVVSSLRSCGFEFLTQDTIDAKPEAFSDMVVGEIWVPHSGFSVAKPGTLSHSLCIAECMYVFGAGDVAHDQSGNNARELLKSARNA